VFNIDELKKELIETKKNDLENNTFNFINRTIEILSHNVLKPFIAIILGIVFSSLKVIFIPSGVAWYSFTILAIYCYAYGVYILIKDNSIKSKIKKTSSGNTKQVEILRNKAIADNNQELKKAIELMTSNPSDIELQALMEYCREKSLI
jgi:hypothetical protein